MPFRGSLAGRRNARTRLRVLSKEEPANEFIWAREDFILFRQLVCKNHSFAHHQKWAKILNTGESNTYLKGCAGPNTDILAPRGSSKSTFLGEWVAWQIGRHLAPDIKLELQILYLSFSREIARSKSAVIKKLIESDEYRKVFPWIKPGDRWADGHWQVDLDWAEVGRMSADFTLYCAGLAGGITSKRAHLVIIDDPIKSSISIENPLIRQKMDSNWVNVVEPTMFEGARAICLGTRFRADDIHKTTFNPDRNWLQLEEKAILTNNTEIETSYWPEQWSIEFLQKKRLDDPIAFSFQYQNHIVRVSEISIDPEWIQYSFPPNNFDYLVIGGDLSSSLKEKADYTVFVLAGRRGNHFWILDYRRGRWVGNQQKIDELIDLWEEWEKPSAWLSIEAIAYQASFAGDFLEYGVNEKGITNLHYKQPSSKGDKLQRLRGVTGLFSNGLVKFNKFRNFKRMTWELENFGAGDHDDCVDALVYALATLISKRGLEID